MNKFKIGDKVFAWDNHLKEYGTEGILVQIINWGANFPFVVKSNKENVWQNVELIETNSPEFDA